MPDLPTFKNLTTAQLQKMMAPFVPFEGATNAQISENYLAELRAWHKARMQVHRQEERAAEQQAELAAEHDEMEAALPEAPPPSWAPPVEPPAEETPPPETP